MKVSVTEALGPEKGRQVKKAGGYGAALFSGFLITSAVWAAVSIFLLLQGLAPMWFLRDAPTGVRVLLLVALLYSPVVIFFSFRAWYKYAHGKEALRQSQAQQQELWDLALGRSEFLQTVSERMVRDGGNYRDDLGGMFSREDLLRAMKDEIDLEQLERRG